MTIARICQLTKSHRAIRMKYLQSLIWWGFGAPGWNRTSDPWLRRPILYPLSYEREGAKNSAFPRARPLGALSNGV